MALNRIQTEGIEDDAITTAKILDGTVGPADIADGALTNTQINASAAIVTSKLSGAVTGIASHGLGTAATLSAGTSANNVVQLDGSGNLPALNASALTSLDAADITGTLPALNGSNLTNLDASDLVGTLPAISGTNLTNLDSADLVGNLPALNGSALTNLDSADLVGNLPALNGSNLTNLTAANLTGALPAINGSALTGVIADTSAIEANLSVLAFKVQVSGNLAKFNLVDQVVDEYKDDSGLGTQTDVDRSGSTAADGYIATNPAGNATGTLISTANTALSAPTTADIVMMIENSSGTATLNTDIKVYVTRNGGTGWDQGTLVDKGTWGTNKKILTANNVAFSNSASGTDMRYKIVWANQVNGSKVTKVHALSLGWA